jgi:phospholipase/carboxylesterase
MHTKNSRTAGKELIATNKVLIMLHGRGGSASDILSLSAHLHVQEFSLIAPEATGHSWYPHSFLAPAADNEPHLSSALAMLQELLADVNSKGIPTENIYFAGFSQGACLALEFVARNAARFGGVVAFTGGLIGDTIRRENYQGDFEGTPVFIGTSNPDPHVPVERVRATAEVLESMNAVVTEKVYNNMGHTINRDEIDNANKIVFDRAIFPV